MNERPTVNNSLAIFLVNQAVRLCSCAYNGLDEKGKPLPGSSNGPAVSFFKTMDDAIKPGDLVIVPTTTRVGFTAVQVAEVDLEVDFDSHENVRWIVSSIDKAAFDEVNAKEAKFLAVVREADKRQRQEKLREQFLAVLSDQERAAVPVIDLKPLDEPPVAAAKE